MVWYNIGSSKTEKQKNDKLSQYLKIWRRFSLLMIFILHNSLKF